ncbi:MAG: hypothetical protein R3D55_26235 [Chloroflexota bacterium]
MNQIKYRVWMWVSLLLLLALLVVPLVTAVAGTIQPQAIAASAAYNTEDDPLHDRAGAGRVTDPECSAGICPIPIND